jgi:hypothetical protein
VQLCVDGRGTETRCRHGCERPSLWCESLSNGSPPSHASFVSRSQGQSCELCPTTAGASMWCWFLPNEATRKPFCHRLAKTKSQQADNKLRSDRRDQPQTAPLTSQGRLNPYLDGSILDWNRGHNNGNSLSAWCFRARCSCPFRG